MPKLKNLSEHNRERWDAQSGIFSNRPLPNGLGCPVVDCGAELFDTDPMSTLTVCPPQKRVHCDKCGFVGTRLV